MAKRATRAQVAQETVSILERGHYLTPAGQQVSIRDALASAKARSVLYTPDEFTVVFSRRDQRFKDRGVRPAVDFEVVNETTLHAARRLLQEVGRSILALNFASARHPGGGFLKGSQAQEESLARASGLYASLTQFPQMYDANARFPSCLYTDHLIYSPDVPVFRDDEDRLLEQPCVVSFVTAPAVNAGAVRRNEAHHEARIAPTMRARIEKVLSLAVLHSHETLVLGAWGCGVFANNPADVACWFAHHLAGSGLFRAAFERVVFAVLDRSADRSTIRPFEQIFRDVS
jgi:uncharacterized protein (TIGR02452 family)